MLEAFVINNDYMTFKERIRELKYHNIQYQEKFPPVYEISNEYYKAFKDYFKRKQNYKKHKVIKFRDITNQHVEYFNQIMSK